MSRLRTLRTVSLLLGVLLMISIGPPAARAAGPEQIVNGTFDNGLVGWTAYPTSSVIDGRGCISVPAGTGAYGAAISQQVALQAGETYELSFDIASVPSTNGYVRVVIQSGPDLNYTQFLTAQKFEIPSTSTTKSFTFTASADYPNADVLFQQDVGNDIDYQLCLDNVSLTGGAPPEVYQPNTGPRVRVNQVGYLPDGPKSATLVTDDTEPVPLAAAGTPPDAVVGEGWTTSRRRGRQLRAERRDHRLRRRPPLRRRLHAGRRRRDQPTRSTIGSDIYQRCGTDAQDVLLHPAQRHPILDALVGPGTAGRPGTSASRRTRATRQRPACHSATMPEALRTALDLRLPARRLGWLVRRRRPRQVRGQRRHRGGAAAAGVRAHPDRADRRPPGAARRHAGHPGERQRRARHPRRGPLGARVPAEDAGPGRRAVRRAWCTTRSHDANWTGLPLRPGRRPAGARAAPAVDRGHAQPGRRRGAGRPALRARTTGASRRSCSRRRHHGLRGGEGAPGRLRPAPDAARTTAAAPTTTTTSPTSSTGRRPSCTSPPASSTYRERRAGLAAAHRPTSSTPAGSAGSDRGRSAGSTWPPSRTGCPAATGSIRR